MPSGWDAYYIVFLSALLGLGIPLFLKGLSALLSSRQNGMSSQGSHIKSGADGRISSPSSATSSDHLGRRINVRFFVGTNASMVLVGMGLLLVPCIGTLQDGDGSRGLIAIVSVAGFAALGLFYASSKGDLAWLRAWRPTDPPKRDDS